MLNFSIVAAYTPKVAVDIVDDTAIYNSDIIQRINDNLIANLSAENKFIITDKEEADYIVEGKLTGMGIGQLVNNPLGTVFTISGSAASLFVSPFAGPVIGGVGLLQTRKNVFAISVDVHISRSLDKEIVKHKGFLGSTNLKKTPMSFDVLNSTIDKTAEIIAKYFINDIERESSRIFVEPPRRIKFVY